MFFMGKESDASVMLRVPYVTYGVSYHRTKKRLGAKTKKKVEVMIS